MLVMLVMLVMRCRLWLHHWRLLMLAPALVMLPLLLPCRQSLGVRLWRRATLSLALSPALPLLTRGLGLGLLMVMSMLPLMLLTRLVLGGTAGATVAM